MKTVRVHLAAGEEVEDARRAVGDVMEMLNRHFRPRGVEFVGAGEGESDWTIVLYWKDFGEMEREEFEAVYNAFKKEKKPVIHVFFKEPDAGAGEVLKAFKEAFAERYGHFYCHFETADAVRFQLAAQSLSLLPGGGGRELLVVDGGVVRMGAEPVAKMEDLSFARLNEKRKSLVRQIAAAEVEVAGLEEGLSGTPDDADLQDALRAARERRHDLQEEMKLHDGFLFNAAVAFAKASAEETSERTRKAWTLFQHGKVREANKVLDWDVLDESAERNRRLFRVQRDALEKNMQEYLAKAKIAMADDSMSVTERVDAASRAYGEAIAIAREIHWEDEKLAGVLFDYACLIDQQHRFEPSIRLYTEALEIYRRLAAGDPVAYEPDLAMTLNNLANLHKDTQRLSAAEEEFVEALEIYRRLAETSPEAGEPDLARTLSNLANLHKNTQRLSEAEEEYAEALEICRRLAAGNPETYEPDLAMTLNNLANLHGVTQRLAEAETEFAEAMEIYRWLAAGNPETYEPDLAITLNNLANLHKDAQRLSEAEEEYAEALEICRRLSAENPEAHEPALAMTLNNLVALHGGARRIAEAEAECAEALEIYRRLAATSPETYEPDLVMALNNMANLHSDARRLTEAEEEYVEALGICRRLVAGNPEAYEPDLARALNNLANLHGGMRRLAEAEMEWAEAFKLYGKLVKVQPMHYLEALASTLFALSLIHAENGQLETALIEMKKVVALCRQNSERLESLLDEARRAVLQLSQKTIFSKIKVVEMNNYKENAEIVRVIFETDGWDVKMQDSGEAVWFTGAVGGFQGVCKAFPFRVLVDDKFAHVYGIFPESMRDNLPSAAEFITRVNYGNRFGAFEMNYDTGEVRFHVMLMMSAVLANNDVVPATIGLVVTTLDRYSRGLFMILLGIRDAGEIFKDFEVK